MESLKKQLQLFSDKKIAILGLGVEGLSSARFLAKHRAHLVIFDQKSESEIDPVIINEVKDLKIACILGKQAFKQLQKEKFDLVIRSPGINKNEVFLLDAAKSGAIITSQTQLFFDLCKSPIIGVTGTKGKGTTATLIYEMLKKDGKDAYLGGNIGLPPLEFLEKLSDDSIVVLELSSFQLHDLHTSPHIAVMLMVVPEHLDYHDNAEDYLDAKRNLLRFQKSTDFAVLNRDYIATNESDIYTDGKVYFVSRERKVNEGCYVYNNAFWVRQHGKEEKIILTKDILLPGKHNWENVCAAIMAAILAGVKEESIVSVLKTFKGLEHRLEFVREVNGVRYFDDSFSTTPETAIAAIEAFAEPEILILGGSSKNSDFTQLGNTISEAQNIKAIIGIGEEWKRIKESLHNLPHHVLLVEGADSMHKAVRAAATIAKKGDVVILSPACASFDMFKNYKERGNLFKEEVFKL